MTTDPWSPCCGEPLLEWTDYGCSMVYCWEPSHGAEVAEIRHTRPAPVFARCVNCNRRSPIAELPAGTGAGTPTTSERPVVMAASSLSEPT